MGNKPSSLELNYGHLYLTQGGKLEKYTSEENYLPMSLKMRKSLLERKRFCHFVPQRKILEVDEHVCKDYDKCTTKKEDEGSEISTNEVGFLKDCGKEERCSNFEFEVKDAYKKANTKRAEPVVTVLNVSAIKDLSKSQLDISQADNNNQSIQSFPSGKYKPCQKSPNPTNKTYSLINLGTGLKKSKFTLELEDKLRQSKLDLGFDADLNDWKEFTYRMESSEYRKRSEFIPKVKLHGEANSVGKGLEKVCLKDPLQYCSHDCQILGLCSVRPDIFRKKEYIEPNLIEVNVNQKLSAKGSFIDTEDVHKKEACDCQHCKLAFLTEMKFPEHCENKEPITKKISKNRNIYTLKRNIKSNREILEITKSDKSGNSIAVSVEDRSVRHSTTNSLFSDNVSSISNLSSENCEDITNKRIRQMFRNNKEPPVKEIFKRPIDLHDEISTLCMPAEETCSSTYYTNSSPERMVQVQTAGLRQSAVFRRCNVDKKSSISTLGASVSSSLSTIMSYKRVRRIFQNIIEKNRNKRRPRKNIHKFRELEELGLGEVKNNRWYPSDSKTYTIWSDLHQSVQGVQAEFKKYPKTSFK